MLLNVLLIPSLVGVVLVVVHCFFGQIIISRGIVFLDLAMAQFASLGYLISHYLGDIKGIKFFSGLNPQVISIFSVAIPAVILAVIADKDTKKFLEAIIAMLYAFSFSASVLIVENMPGGFEEIKEQFLGSLVTVTKGDLIHIILMYSPIMVINILLLKKYLQQETTVLIEGIFYFLLGIVVTSSVKLVGVFTVFTLLVIPPLISHLVFNSFTARLIFSYIIGIIVLVVSLLLINLPTAPLITFILGSLFFIIYFVKKVILRR
jgi:zinc/manganese transport system permease protein